MGELVTVYRSRYPGAAAAATEPRAAADQAARIDLRALYDRHYRPLILLAHLLGADDPEDIVAEAFVRLHEKTETLADAQTAPAYLRRIVVNLCRNRTSHLAVERRAALPFERDHPPADGPAIAAVAHQELMAALNQLSPRHREALVLRFWLDLSEAQMAQAMGTSRGSVKAHVSRGLAALRKALGGGHLDG